MGEKIFYALRWDTNAAAPFIMAPNPTIDAMFLGVTLFSLASLSMASILSYILLNTAGSVLSANF